MSGDSRNLLSVLKAELEFVEKGGYRSTARAPWRPHFVFQDSPACLNFDPTRERRECADCVLMQLVPVESRAAKVPCRYIRLNDAGETIDALYRYASQDELEIALRKWLTATIQQLEETEGKAAKGKANDAVSLQGPQERSQDYT